MLAVKRTDGNLMFLYAVYLASLSVGNVLDSSYVYIFSVTLPASVLTYPLTFLVANIIRELWEEKYASRLVLLGFSVKFVGIVLLGLSRLVTTFPDWGAQRDLWNALGTSFWEVGAQWVLGKDYRFWTISILSFPLAQFANVWVFDFMLRRHIRKTGGPWGGRWVRYLTAALVGESIEACLFIALLYQPNWILVRRFIFSQLYVRVIFTFYTLPLFYALTWRKKRGGGECRIWKMSSYGIWWTEP